MAVTEETDSLSIAYNELSPESYKGLLHLNFEEKNLSAFENTGKISLKFFVESLGSQKQRK